MMQRGRHAAVWIGLSALMLAVIGSARGDERRAQVRFNRDIRPILSEACFQCHGPDANARQAELRLDQREDAVRDRGDYAAIVPGTPAASELVARITSSDPDRKMPPPDAQRQLSPREVDRLTEWIAQGAEYEPHWAFIPPSRPAMPIVERSDWPRNGIDVFILSRLEQEQLRPAPETDRSPLLRRVTLDLIGLPPSPAEVAAFLNDPAPDAYEKAVDRLLASARYGEHMALPWLDAARYADTNGYQSDGPRHMWRWRDWVIDAFNRNLPFDQFTIEQLAGDLLPDATVEQRIATGFNRNHRGNAEGGIIPEEFRVEYVVDRVDTTAAVWLGLTAGCARCHDHKYDPLTQTDYYRLFAYFNNIDEPGKVIRDDNSPPLIKAPTQPMQQRLAAFDREIAIARAACEAIELKLAEAQRQWERTLHSAELADWSVPDGIAARFAFDESTPASGAFLDGAPALSAGAVGTAAGFDGSCYFDAGDVGNFDSTDRFSFGAWVKPSGEAGGAVLARVDEELSGVGYSLRLDGGRVHVEIVNRELDDALRVEAVAPLAPDRWQHLLATYDGSKAAKGVCLYIDGQPAELRVTSDTLSNPITHKKPLLIGALGEGRYRFEGAIDEVLLYGRVLSSEEARILATAATIVEIAAVPAPDRTADQILKLRTCYLQQHAPPELRKQFESLWSLESERIRFLEQIPTAMVMQEMAEPRQTFVLLRGEYDKPGPPVTPGLPVSLAGPLDRQPAARLGLARWLVSPENPLTPRVIANRIWQMHFGTGLVKTSEDFGSQGELPTHPELLDWMAVEFMESGWDMKHLHRLIVTSATYRQASSAELGVRNAERHAATGDSRSAPQSELPAPSSPGLSNRLLSHGPRLRLSAHTIRDQALAVSGLLVEELGGPSVKPYQPAGLWEEITTNSRYEQDRGEKLYRRGLYTYWKRTVTQPMMTIFDAAGREMCMVRQETTNTPLQALTLMNDVTFVEAARGLAQRMIREGGAAPDERIAYGFGLTVCREPTSRERAVLLRTWKRSLTRFQSDPNAAAQLVSVGESPLDESLDVSELAAWTAVANVLLNLDETINKP